MSDELLADVIRELPDLAGELGLSAPHPGPPPQRGEGDCLPHLGPPQLSGQGDRAPHPGPAGVVAEREAMVEALKAAAGVLGEDLTVHEFLRHSGYSRNKIYRRFGSFTAMRVAAGLRPAADRRGKFGYQKEHVLAEAKRFFSSRAEGERVSQRQFRQATGISDNVVCRLFGTWTDLVRSAAPNRSVRPPRYSREEMLAEGRRAIEKLGPDATFDEFFGAVSYSPAPVNREFGGWMKFREELGLPPRSGKHRRVVHTHESVLERFEKFAGMYGEEGTMEQFYSLTGISPPVVRRLFGSWGDLRRLLNLPARKRRLVSDEELLEQLAGLQRRLRRFPTAAEVNRLCRTSWGTLRQRFGNKRAIVQALVEFLRRERGGPQTAATAAAAGGR